MSQHHLSINPDPEARTAQVPDAWTSGHRRPHPLRFVVHLVEMIAVMGIGMAVGVTAFRLVVGGLTSDEAAAQYPVLSVAVLAVSMTAPMVAWMRFRGHGLRSCVEMALSMVLPAAPILVLYALGVIDGPAGLYCCTSMWTMAVYMIYRRSDYGM